MLMTLLNTCEHMNLDKRFMHKYVPQVFNTVSIQVAVYNQETLGGCKNFGLH